MQSSKQVPLRPPLDRWLSGLIEGVFLFLIVISPWVFAEYYQLFRLMTSVLLSLLFTLAAFRLILVRNVLRRGLFPLSFLAGLVLLTCLHLLPTSAPILSVISPNSADLLAENLPNEREILPGEIQTQPFLTDITIGLEPAKARNHLINLVGLSLLYLVLIQHLATPECFFRFAWTCAVNGTLLSLLGLAQYLSSPHDVIYWTIQSDRPVVFGPFFNRNHFATFINFCIGMGLSLLLIASRRKAGILHNARGIWLLACIAVMLTALMMSMSRGGILAFAVALMLVGIVWVAEKRRQSLSVGWLLAVVAVATVIGAWFGLVPLEKRFESLTDENANRFGRIDTWIDSLTLFPKYPILGTGNGSFNTMEQRVRTAVGTEKAIVVHAHNEYVEALIESGLLGLGLTVGLIGAVSLEGIRRYRRLAGRSMSLLVLGGLIGFWSLALHSFVEFSIHRQAVAVLATSVAAFLTTARGEVADSDWAVTPRPIAYILGSGLIVFGLLLTREHYNQYWGDRYFQAALAPSSGDPSQVLEKRIKYLKTAVEFQPRLASYHLALGDAYLSLLLVEPDGPEASQLIVHALRHWRDARDLNPLDADSHVRLGSYRDYFVRADPAILYLERARNARPIDPTIWFACGLERFKNGDDEQAFSNWRHSLRLSNRLLNEIVKEAGKRFTVTETLERSLPDQPEVIHEVVHKIFPEDASKRSPFLTKASLLLVQNSNRTPQQDYLLGRIWRELERYDESVTTLKSALNRNAELNECRLELARAYYDLENFADARKELKIILARQPANGGARDLLGVVEREIKIREP